ncbi:MAG: LysR family transcriptional regulator [Treponemataceae bacterium]|nr:LysR family transcriptional regulator [Treponemataceae bacterium]
MDLEFLRQRASIMQALREFFISRNFLELDTGALAENLIPETCLEVFRTEYLEPWSGKSHELYLVPSPEIHIKPIIARHKVDVFQLSKCYRNVESVGKTHASEFTMLEYYKMDANYIDSLELTEKLFEFLGEKLSKVGITLADDLKPPFARLTINDAFRTYCGFSLFENDNQISTEDLAEQARRLGIFEPTENKFSSWNWEELYNAIFVQFVEPNLPKDKCVFLMDYPSEVRCLAQNNDKFTKERWELYGRGIELANCYSEETDGKLVKEYFEIEGKEKNETARIKHAINGDYWRNFASSSEGGYTKDGFPKCSGTAMGIDRLIMLLCGKSDISLVSCI